MSDDVYATEEAAEREMAAQRNAFAAKVEHWQERVEAAERRLVEVERTGAGLIAAERRRQVDEEGWSPDHDDGHKQGQLARAAACYATPDERRLTIVRDGETFPEQWPWRPRYWKPTGDRVRDLVKAGALIAAEIDRLLRFHAALDTDRVHAEWDRDDTQRWEHAAAADPDREDL